MTLKEAIQAYTERFDEGPPIFGMEPEEAIALIEEALKKDEPIKEGAEINAPDGAVL